MPAHPTGKTGPRIVAEPDTSCCRVAVVSQFELSIGCGGCLEVSMTTIPALRYRSQPYS